MGSVIKKRRKRMSKKEHRKMLRRTRVQRRKFDKQASIPAVIARARVLRRVHVSKAKPA